MSNKADLQRKLSEIGYQVGPFASKDTLSNVIRLHSSALQNTGVDVAKLNDLDLRKSLTENGHAVGPVTNHTRSIYQRKLLEVLTNESSEGREDEIEVEVPTSTTPPRSTTRNSTVRSGDNSITSSPGRVYAKESQEPRIPLTRVDISERNTQNFSSFYPNLSNTKPRPEPTITNSYSPQRSSVKPESRTNNSSYGLRDPYDFQNDEPTIIRHEHRATPFRTANISSSETFSSNTSRYSKPSDIPTSTRPAFNSGNDISEMRSRILTKTNEQKEVPINKDSPFKKAGLYNEFEPKKSTNNDKLDVATKNNGTYLYSGITIAVALIVFVIYMLLVK